MSVSGIGTTGSPMVGYETKSTENNVSENQFMDTLLETESTNKNAHAASIHAVFTFFGAFGATERKAASA